MATPWCRLWSDMPNDPKWRTIARASGRSISEVVAVYVHMLVCASNATERGRTQSFCDEDVASALDLEAEHITCIRTAMQGRVIDGDRLTGWDKRQPVREDGAAERAKSWRNKKKEEKTGREERNRTHANATERAPNAEERPEVDTEVDADKDTETSTSGTTKMTRKEFSDLYTLTFGKLMPGMLNQTATDCCATYSPETIREAFRVGAEKGAGSFSYVQKVLQGEGRKNEEDFESFLDSLNAKHGRGADAGANG